MARVPCSGGHQREEGDRAGGLGVHKLPITGQGLHRSQFQALG